MTTYNDPFTQLYMGLWEMLWNHPDLADAVADTPSSRIKFVSTDGQVDPKFKTWLDMSSEADLPAVTLMSVTTGFRDQASSSGHSVTKGFAVGIYVGSYNLNAHLNPIAWYVTQAMDRYQDLLAMQWKGEHFIKRVQLGAGQTSIQAEGQFDQVLPKGWVSVWDANALLWFSHNVLRGEN